MDLTRRRLLLNGLFGAGALGLRSLATGIPVSILANPRAALARSRRLSAATTPAPQYIIFQTSGNGDPLNCNAPGMYLDPNIGHPQSDSMAPTSMTLGGQAYTAALPWTQLPQALLNQSCFFNHGTYTVVHADEQSVLELGGFTANNAMLVSLLAAQLAPVLKTIQSQPVVLGPRLASEDVIFQGSPQPIISPSALSLLLAPPKGVLNTLMQLRDSDLNSLNALVKSEGTPAQGAFIDQYVQSQTQLRSVSETLLSLLQGIPDNSVSSQIAAAIILIRMNVSPVISINIPFGGDNHTDGGLMTEAQQTVSGVAALGDLWSQLVANNLQDQVSFLSLNVFGRTLDASTSASGREHNAGHHIALMFGPAFNGSVIGGVEPVDGDYSAMSIDSATGAGVAGGGGDIPFTSTLQSMAMTFGVGVGVDQTFLASNIAGGTVVAPALVAA